MRMSTSHIPLDIQFLIIRRLPTKSLILFKSVCKAWKSFIDCFEFTAGYSFCHTQSQHLMISYQVIGDREKREVKYVSYVDDDTFPQQKFDLTVPHLLQETTILGSSHGLFCLTGYYCGEPGDDSSRKQMAILWNPAISKAVVVHVPNVVLPQFHSVVGFGVCPDTKDPKLVNVTYIDDYWKIETINCFPCQVMIFTLSSGEWTTSCSNLPHKSIQFRSVQVVIGQFIYWLAYDENDEDEELVDNLIMSFNLNTDEFREVHLPHSLRKAYLSASTLRESLVLLDHYYTLTIPYKEVCDVWMMEHGDPKVFKKLYTINAPHALVGRTLGFRKNGEPIIIEMQHNTCDPTFALAIYEPCLEDIKDLGICGNNFSFSWSSYTISLLLLHDDDHCHIVRCGDVKK